MQSKLLFQQLTGRSSVKLLGIVQVSFTLSRFSAPVRPGLDTGVNRDHSVETLGRMSLGINRVEPAITG